jgi:hypothetical protein
VKYENDRILAIEVPREDCEDDFTGIQQTSVMKSQFRKQKTAVLGTQIKCLEECIEVPFD